MLTEILVPIAIFAAIFGIVYVVVTSRNRERMAMIEKGVDPKDFLTKPKTNNNGIIKWALLLVGVGIGLFLGSILEAYTRYSRRTCLFCLFAAFVDSDWALS